MTQSAGASLSFAELRDALKARVDELGHSDDIDLIETLRYLTTLPGDAHTQDRARTRMEALIASGM